MLFMTFESVAPHVGAWIETNYFYSVMAISESLPTWERGLKLDMGLGKTVSTLVAPHVGAWIETPLLLPKDRESGVAPHVGAWIETGVMMTLRYFSTVAPHVGAWIETSIISFILLICFVAPHVGAWIETCAHVCSALYSLVAPHVGAWIETSGLPPERALYRSLPTWERGLKHDYDLEHSHHQGVAPHVGAWIETQGSNITLDANDCRSPRGSVD